MNFRGGLTIFSIIIACALAVSGMILANNFNHASTDITPAPDLFLPQNTPSVSANENPVNILLLCEEEGIANDIYILNYTPETGVASFLTIPGNTKTIYGTKFNTLTREKGIISLIDYIKVNLGFNIRYYVKFDYTALKYIVDGVDGVTYHLPADFYSETTNLKAGTQTYSGDMAVALFRFTEPAEGLYTQELSQYYDGTPYARTLLHTDFITSLLTQKGNASYIPKMTEILEQCQTRIETNVTVDEWSTLISTAETINIKKLTQYILSGTEETDGKQFFISSDNIKELDGVREYLLSEVTNSIFWSSSLS